MKAGENKALRALVKEFERGRTEKKTTMVALAAVGLIGFGIMLVPILDASLHPLPLATVQQATKVAAAPDAYTHAALLAQAAVVYDLSTGHVLYEKNAEAQLPLASLTKLLTMYAAARALPTNAPVVITDEAVAQDGDSGLKAGESFAFGDIARLALVASSNDAAEAIDEAASAHENTSGQSLLASAAAAAGLTQTYALNGTGLDVNTKISGGYGSAIDVAKLAGAFLAEAPEIARATIEPSITIRSSTGVAHTLSNTNQDIVRMPSPLLSKTGYTDLADGNLAVIFDAGINHPIAVVVLGSTVNGRFTDVDQLVSLTLDHFAGLSGEERSATQ